MCLAREPGVEPGLTVLETVSLPLTDSLARPRGARWREGSCIPPPRGNTTVTLVKT